VTRKKEEILKSANGPVWVSFAANKKAWKKDRAIPGMFPWRMFVRDGESETEIRVKDWRIDGKIDFANLRPEALAERDCHGVLARVRIFCRYTVRYHIAHIHPAPVP
jgi:hypothetical protein